MSGNYVRQLEEKAKFQNLLRTLIWAKSRTGKSSAEITSVILRRGKDGLDRYWGNTAQFQ